MGLLGKKKEKDTKNANKADAKVVAQPKKADPKAQKVEKKPVASKAADKKVADKKSVDKKAANNKPVAQKVEKKAAPASKTTAKAAPAPKAAANKATAPAPSRNGKFIIRKATANYVFALQAANFENVATSGSGYKSLDAAKLGVESTKRFLNSPIQDLTLNKVEDVKNPKYEIYLDKAEKFRFRLKANNGEIILVSDAYSSKSSCKNGITSIQKHAPFADVEVVKPEKGTK